MTASLREHDLVERALAIEPNRSNVILIVGAKGSGKSELARAWFDNWPFDRVVIDVTGDARPEVKPPDRVQAFIAPFPSQLPEPDESEDERRVTAWARVDPRSAMFASDQDQALALALYPRHRKVLCWVDEYGQAATANKIGPNMRLALHSSRHYYLTLLLACPRPRHIPTVTATQADKVAVFRLPNPDDREWVAKNAGVPFQLFERTYHDTQRRYGRHGFVLWDNAEQTLIQCAPIPIETRDRAAPPA